MSKLNEINIRLWHPNSRKYYQLESWDKRRGRCSGSRGSEIYYFYDDMVVPERMIGRDSKDNPIYVGDQLLVTIYGTGEDIDFLQLYDVEDETALRDIWNTLKDEYNHSRALVVGNKETPYKE